MGKIDRGTPIQMKDSEICVTTKLCEFWSLLKPAAFYSEPEAKQSFTANVIENADWTKAKVSWVTWFLELFSQRVDMISGYRNVLTDWKNGPFHSNPKERL